MENQGDLGGGEEKKIRKPGGGRLSGKDPQSTSCWWNVEKKKGG